MKQASSTNKIMTAEEAMTLYESAPVDIAILGGGPAGYSAAINGCTRGRSVLILSGDYRDSYLYKAALIENMPGTPRISGAELLDRLHAHALDMGTIMIKGQATLALVSELYDSAQRPVPGFQIAYGAHILQARTLILSTGASSGVTFPGEQEFLGRGVSYCATCDGMLYRGKEVAVIAQAKDALEEALHLSKIGCKVSLFIRPADEKRWGLAIPQDIFDKVVYSSKYAILGADNVSGLRADEKEYAADGIFILRATISPATLLSELALADTFIQTDKKQQTNIPGVFAAGDCTGKPFQIAKAIGEGQIAGLSADSYLSELEAAQKVAGAST